MAFGRAARLTSERPSISHSSRWAPPLLIILLDGSSCRSFFLPSRSRTSRFLRQNLQLAPFGAHVRHLWCGAASSLLSRLTPPPLSIFSPWTPAVGAFPHGASTSPWCVLPLPAAGVGPCMASLLSLVGCAQHLLPPSLFPTHASRLAAARIAAVLRVGLIVPYRRRRSLPRRARRSCSSRCPPVCGRLARLPGAANPAWCPA